MSTPSAIREYAVFISYRHADNAEMGRKWANWLHEALESYEVPPDLVGKTSLRGDKVTTSLYPVFRDEAELPADADLSTNIRRALENSRLLVVLCSPRAVVSRFVEDEIRYFKELGKSDRILALMIDGEPNASDDPAKVKVFGAEAECFPAPLRFGVPVDGDAKKIDWNARTEPIAADVRPGGHCAQGWTTAAAYREEWVKDGKLTARQINSAVQEYGERLELAKLKIIAGALGLPLGELTQRDKAYQLVKARRRQKLIATVAVVFGVLAVCAVGGAVLAWLKQQEAVRQKILAQESEARALHNLGLAHTMRDRSQELNLFFIGDLRTKLRALGRLDLLEEATRRVVAYHEQIPAELANEPEMLRARAMAMDYSGQIAQNQGDAALAVQRLEASHAAWSRMIAADVGGVEAVEGFAVSSRMLGEALQSAGKPAEALKQFQQGCEALEGLHGKNEAGVAQLNRLRSTLLVVRGNAHYGLGDHAAALRDLDAAADLARQATEARPKERANWEQVVQAFEELAQHYLRIHDHPAALKQSKAAVEAAEALIKLDIENASGWYIAAGSYGSLLMAQAAAKDWPAAVEAAETQLIWRKRYFQRDTLNPAAEVLLAGAHDDLGFALTYSREEERAVEEFSEAVRILAGLIQRHPSRNDWRRDLGLVFKRRADLFFEAEAWELALKDYDNSLRMCRLLAKAAPEDVDACTRLANTLTAKGETQWKMGDLSGAQQTFEEGLKALQGLPQDHPEVAERLKGLKAAMAALALKAARGAAPATPRTGMPTGQ